MTGITFLVCETPAVRHIKMYFSVYYRLLKNSTFFGAVTAKNGDYSLTDDELYVGSIVLRLINVCPCNCHDVSEFESPTLDKFGGACTKVSVGAGIFPTLALLNHSCDPSFMRCNNGRSILCVANKNIKKGKSSVYLI